MLKNRKIYSLALVALILSGACATSACEKIAKNRELFTANGKKRSATRNTTSLYAGAEIPVNPPSLPSQIKEYEGYTVSFNPRTGNPNWSAWELTAEETAGSSTRKDAKFWKDSEINGCATSQDYVRSGYDRGHLCPAADMKWSVAAMNDCFSMANITPQDHSLNSGAWSTLENKCRLWAQREGRILIAAGPIYEGRSQTIADGRIKVPTAFFKVIVAPDLDVPQGIAFVYPNAPSPGNYRDYAMTIDDVENLTGYDFFSALPDEIENRMESYYDFNYWNR